MLAPFLGTFYGEALENGELRLQFDEDGLGVRYYDLRFPLKMDSYRKVFTLGLSRLKNETGADHPDLIRLRSILYALKNLPPGGGGERNRQIQSIKRNLWELYTHNARIRSYIDDIIAAFNGTRNDPASFNLLDRLLSEQYFRLSFWKVASEELNYRRFFIINDLISLKEENAMVFDRTHSLILRNTREGSFTALRVDHIDGLYDPAAYLRRLCAETGGCYTVVEKILQFEEELPDTWPVQGTTGYDFLNHVNSLFCNTAAQQRMDRSYYRFLGYPQHYENLVVEKKRLIIGRYMAGDVDELAQLMKRYSGEDRQGKDITLYGLKRALVEILALFPVYRTYISGESYSDDDRAVIRSTLRQARESSPGFAKELDFIEKYLLLQFKEYIDDEQKKHWLDFVMRFQQLTGPLMAKGFEDTVLYVYNRLISLNEVGGDPGRFGISTEEFHNFNLQRQADWPLTMNATATHDTKRGEDARARINVLSELPDEWRSNVRAWARMNAAKKSIIRTREMPSKNDEYFLYQTMIGTFPFEPFTLKDYRDRLKACMIKAVREAKIYTAWLKPDEDYENAFTAFIDALLSDDRNNSFLSSFTAFQKKVAYYGLFNSLSQLLLKVACPGIPDFYQGTELWDFNMVDPDNRRTVNYESRRSFLTSQQSKTAVDIPALLHELLDNYQDGRIKQFLTWKLLSARAERSALFNEGSYLPLTVEGKFKNHVIAFARNRRNEWALAITARFLTGVFDKWLWDRGKEFWADTRIILSVNFGGQLTDRITGNAFESTDEISLAKVFTHLPAALLFNDL
jgi:(1->4)-alpha-D-glucan 1-alpha-D-glucosylmutase